jgi:toxin ParE1/3/4
MAERRLLTHERDLRDLDQRFEYIRQHNPEAALRFLDAAEDTIRLLAASPGLGARYDPEHPRLAEIRCFPISHFKNDLLFYQPFDDRIEILRVLHGAQDIGRVLAEDLGIEEDPD